MKVIRMSSIMKDGGLRKSVVKDIIDGKVFLYPTDTIYGLGCDATNKEAVKRIRGIKTGNQPFSVIAPSRDWILKNMEARSPESLRKLPGAYTLVMRMRRPVVCREVSEGTLGVRIPDHPFTGLVEEAGVPFVTTSANISGEAPLWSLRGVPSDIERRVDIGVDGGILKGPGSRVIDLTGNKAKVLRK